MKLLLLHGPAQINSRSKLLELKEDFKKNDIVTFTVDSNLQDILGTISTPSLLSENQLIILENPPEDLTLPLFSNSDPLSIIIWFDHEVPAKKLILESVKKTQGEIMFFPAEKEASIFPLLDLLANRDKRAFLELAKLQKTHEKFSDLQYLITMIFYLLRSLLITPNNAAPFVKQKLDKQRQNFSKAEIEDLYQTTLETDYKIKSGLLDLKQAELQLINKFLLS